MSVEHIKEGHTGWLWSDAIKSYSCRQSPYWVKADLAQHLLSSNDPLTIVVMTLSKSVKLLSRNCETDVDTLMRFVADLY